MLMVVHCHLRLYISVFMQPSVNYVNIHSPVSSHASEYMFCWDHGTPRRDSMCKITSNDGYSQRITVNSPQNQLVHPTNPPHYQLAPTNSPHLFYQLAPLLLPTRPMLFVNSPQLLPTRPISLTNSPHFSYQLAPRFCQLSPLLGPCRLRL